MGYEIIYSFHERNEDGSYDTGEKKTQKRRVGTPYDDAPLEKVAQAVMMQLARREILVVDVEVYEFARKKLSYKESNGGIVIKNKRFTLDQCGEIQGTEVQQQRPTVPQVYEEVAEFLPEDELPVLRMEQPPQRQVDHDAVKGGGINYADAHYFKTHKPIREEIYAPRDKAVASVARQRGLAFTLGKRYPIYEEKMAPGGLHAGMLYVTVDDKKRKQIINARHFDTPVQLIGGDQFNDSQDDYSSETADLSMPNLR